MFGYIITTLASIFWIFRVIVMIMYTTGTKLPIAPMNVTFEIVLLFITFVCIILIAKRKMLGAVIYLIAQCAYLGVDADKKIDTIITPRTLTTNYI